MDENRNDKRVITILIAIIIVLAVVLVLIVTNLKKEELYENNLNTEIEQGAPKVELETNISVVPTMKDEISDNSAWCPTFQLVWNDMQDTLVDGDVKFQEENVMVDNLNEQSFKSTDISEDYYYKNFGMMSKKLKTEIEKGIEEKFQEKSDILDMFEWPEKASDKRYFFYSMLKRSFEFENEFKILENKNFAQTENVEYFGVDLETDQVVRNQVEVLYYTSEDDFGVTLYTKQGDEVMIVRAPTGKTFAEILENVDEKQKKYEGSTSLEAVDVLSIPNLDINALKEYTELAGKEFKLKDGDMAYIEKALQTIQFKLDNKGGEIKSEAGMVTMKMAVLSQEPRIFNCDDNFAIFLKESEKELPYFAAKINDINLFK